MQDLYFYTQAEVVTSSVQLSTSFVCCNNLQYIVEKKFRYIQAIEDFNRVKQEGILAKLPAQIAKDFAANSILVWL